MKSKIILFCLAIAATLAMNAQSLIVEENFNYPVGDALTDHGWEVTDAGGTNPILVGQGSLTYDGYLPNEGNHAVMGTSGEDIYLPFDETVFPDVDGSGTLYAAFVMNVSAIFGNPSYPIHFNRTVSSFFGKLCLKSSETGFTVAIEPSGNPGGSTSWHNQTLNFGENYLFVLKYEKIAGEWNDVMSLYINPVPGQAEPTTPALTKVADQSEAYNLKGFCLRQAATSGSSNFMIDGIRIATTWEEAVKAAETTPEPEPLTTVEENFDYPVGDALTAHGWTQSDEGDNPILVGNGSLTFPGYLPNSGNHAIMQTIGEDVRLSLGGTAFPNQASGSLYAAFVINVSEIHKGMRGVSESYPIYFSSSTLTDEHFSKFCLKSSGEGFTVGIEPSAYATLSSPWYDQTLNFGENYLIVIKYEKIDGEHNDAMSLYVNPVPGQAEPETPTLTKVEDNEYENEATDLIGFCLRQAAMGNMEASSSFTIDGIRIATTWEEAVKAAETIPEPEPTVLPLPYVDNFDGHEGAATSSSDTRIIMDGWVVEDLNPDIAEPESWFLAERVSSMYRAHSEPNSLVCSWSGATYNDYLFTPFFNFEAGKNYTLTFYRRQSPANMSPTTLTVDLFSAQSSASVAQSLNAEFTFPDNQWIKTEVVITPDVTGNYCIGFKVESAGFAGIVGIDDMSLREGNPQVALVAVLPADEAIDVYVNTQVSAQFDHPITITDASKITIANATGVTASVDAENPNQLNIAHDSFEFGATYTVTIDKEAIADFAGEEAITWSFTTVGLDVEVVGQSPVNDDPGIFPKHKILLEFNQTPVVLDESKITINNGVTVEGTTVE
ncbi:MAG: Ig-like domain-containing protein, partial [Prevotellaceae bacterium]|nr:Ig-like domain-containing protein [Prevotellaceae bacterium]